MELLDMEQRATTVAGLATVEGAERAARRSLRAQIARLEGDLADAFVTSFSFRMGGARDPAPIARPQPRVLGLGELERLRDDLADRLRTARATIAEHADAQEASRLLLERMLLEPGRYRLTRVSQRDLGQPGCGVWEVKPRLGLIGMLMDWWQVKLSSGCPLPRGRVQPTRPGDPTE